MRRFFAFILCFICLATVFTVPVFAAENDLKLSSDGEIDVEYDVELSGFIPEGYNYYFCHKWEYNDDYYIGFFSSLPVLDHTLHKESNGWKYYHIIESDGSNPLYYRFTSYDDMINYLILNDASRVEYVYEKTDVPYMRLNQTDSGMFFSNFDIVFSDDGETYYLKNAYSTTETKTEKTGIRYFVGMTASDMFGFLSVDFISVIPVVLGVVFSYFAVRKTIYFIFDTVKGA